MIDKIQLIANSMISESSLPNFALSTKDGAKFMRVCAFDQLDRPLDRYLGGRGQQEVNVLRHKDEGMRFVASVSAMSVKCFQEKPDVGFDDEESPALPGGERHEISSSRGDESSRFQEQTSAAGSRMSFRSLNWHEWNSCPSRWFYFSGFHFGKTD
jgi:hypothetical protein